jgi:hypothetical protein
MRIFLLLSGIDAEKKCKKLVDWIKACKSMKQPTGTELVLCYFPKQRERSKKIRYNTKEVPGITIYKRYIRMSEK